MVYPNATAAPREELTDIIMEGTQDLNEFQGLAVLPERPMNLPTGHVPKIEIGSGNLMRATTRKRAPGTKFDRWQSAIDDFSITLVQVGEEQKIPDEIALTYEDYFPMEQIYTVEAGNRLRRGHEIEVADAIMNTGNFDSVSASPTYAAGNKATMTPVEDMIAAIRRLKARGEAPNTIVIPGPVWDTIRPSTDMVNFIAGAINPNAKVTPNSFQAAMATYGITSVLIPDGYVNRSAEGEADTIEPIWNDGYVFVGKVKTGELVNGGVGRTTYWDKEGPLFNVTTYRDEPVKSNIIRANKTCLPTITNARAGTLIATGL